MPGVHLGMINIGVRAHDLGRRQPADLARRVGAYGFSHVQLAISKAFAGFDGHTRLSPGLARQIAGAFSAEGIHISVLGCYINPVHPDPELREAGLRRFERHLEVSRDFGCSIVGTETGSLSPDNSWNDANASDEVFHGLADAVSRLVRRAERFGVFVGIEGVAGKNVIHRHADMIRLLDEVDSPNLGVIYDPVNFLPDDRLDDSRAHILEAFELFGDRILAIHAKDFAVQADAAGGRKKIPTLPAGQGLLDYRWFFDEISSRFPGIHVLLENNTPESLETTLSQFAALGVRPGNSHDMASDYVSGGSE
jgi:L-ribulose-5-phosphate 3-epimerase